jgi:hypothetical protein
MNVISTRWGDGIARSNGEEEGKKAEKGLACVPWK